MFYGENKMSHFMKKLAILLAMTVAGHASDSIKQTEVPTEKNTSIEIMNNNNIINTLWNNTEYKEIKYDDEQNNDILNAAKELATNSIYLSGKKYYNTDQILYGFLKSLPDNKFNPFSRNNLISLLNDANKLQCRDQRMNTTIVEYEKRENCNDCSEDKIVNDFIELLNNKQYYVEYGNINEFTEYLLKNNYIFYDIGLNDSKHNVIYGMDKMPYYNALHILLNQLYDENQDEIIHFKNKVLLIIKKCLLIPYLHKFLNNHNTNDLYYRVTHYPNNNYEIALFFNDLSENGDNNSLILSLTTYNNTIRCKMNAFHGLYPNKLKAYRNASKNIISSK